MADRAPVASEASAVEAAPPAPQWAIFIGLWLAVLVAGLSSVCIKQLLLPLQVSSLVPQDKHAALALVASVGAVAGLLTLPLVGALSDRTTLPAGRRRPWIAGGIGLAVAGMSLMAFASALPQLLVGEIAAQAGVVTVLAVATALLPDQVPRSHRRLVAAGVGMAPNVGGVIGLLLVSRLSETRIIEEGYVLLAAVSLMGVLVLLAVLDDPPLSPTAVPPFHLGTFLRAFVRPLGVKDFTWTLLSRCCAYLAFTLLGTYLFYYVQEVLHAPTPALSVTLFQSLATLVLFMSSLVAGWLSQRWDRLKPFAVAGGLLMAGGLGVLALVASWPGLVLSALLFGAGFGLFLGVDMELAVRVLPSEQGRAKDLGIMYTSIYLSLIASPLLGGGILQGFHASFTLLFAVASVSSLLAAVAIVPLRSVR